MILSKIKAEYIPQKSGMQGIWEKIEKAGRTCYKSEGNIKYDEYGHSTTAEWFANRLISVLKHRSVAEHATVYLNIPTVTNPGVVNFFINNPYSKVGPVFSKDWEEMLPVTTNYRVLVENDLLDLLQFMVPLTDNHELRYTIRVFTDRGVSAEMNRHRVNSPSERSTRYCIFTEGKLGEVRIINTEFDDEAVDELNYNNAIYDFCTEIGDHDIDDWKELDYWMFANLACEFSYNKLICLGWSPQRARRVLPLDLETELVVTAFESDWIEFFGQRLYGVTGEPHPDMKKTAMEMMLAFRKDAPRLVKKINDRWEEKPVEDPT